MTDFVCKRLTRNPEYTRLSYVQCLDTENFLDNLETRKQSFICAFSICMTVPLIKSYKMLQNVRFITFTVFELLSESHQGME